MIFRLQFWTLASNSMREFSNDCTILLCTEKKKKQEDPEENLDLISLVVGYIPSNPYPLRVKESPPPPDHSPYKSHPLCCFSSVFILSLFVGKTDENNSMKFFALYTTNCSHYFPFCFFDNSFKYHENTN